MTSNASINPDALPQLIGEFRPLDLWQAHINKLFYALRRDRIRHLYQTFATADYRLAHALAADYVERVRRREQSQPDSGPLVIHEWGPGNGNLAACFLTHLAELDRTKRIYPRIRYVLVDIHDVVLDGALQHPDLAAHRERVETVTGDVTGTLPVGDASVDRIICNELWNELPTKLLVRKDGELEEEFVRPNLNERKHAAIDDWSGFVRGFESGDTGALAAFPDFLEDIVWEKEYRKVEWRDVPYRKTITEFLRRIDEHVLVPVNFGAAATLKEAKRLLRAQACGFSSFDAGTGDVAVLNDPDKPCYGQFGGQYSFMVNVALLDAIARQLGIEATVTESQREFVGRALGTNVLTVMDLLATHPQAGSLRGWEQERLVIRTLAALNQTYSSPYRRHVEFPVRDDAPAGERESLAATVAGLKDSGVPDTVAYLTEEEVRQARRDLELLGYEAEAIEMALRMPVQGVEYLHYRFPA